MEGINEFAAPEQAALATSARDSGRWSRERITALHRWRPDLYSLRVTRPRDFRFAAGHYARLGLPEGDGEPVWRPFSMTSGTDEPFLEFLVTHVPGGTFSELLLTRGVGDEILLDRFALGFLTLDQLAPGRDLWLMASGSGVGPFVSMLKDETVWGEFERLIVAHGVRHADGLAYRDQILSLAEARGANGRFRYIPVVTRETCPEALTGHIPDLLSSGELQGRAGTELDVAHSRVMACGNPEMTRGVRALLADRGFAASRRGAPGQMAFEKYW